MLLSAYRRLGLASLLMLGLLPLAQAQTDAPGQPHAYVGHIPQLPGGDGVVAATAAGRQNAQLLSVAYALPIASASQMAVQFPLHTSQADNEAAEAKTMRWGLATRAPSEDDATFLRRVLPASFPQSADLLAATWQPRDAGRKQLFFSVPGSEDADNAYGCTLFMLDPYRSFNYAVQAFILPSLGDATSLTALLFADVDQDGQKELLAISECSLREPNGRETQYQTQVFQYMGRTSNGRPQYREDPTPRPYLTGLASAAAVRLALAQHQPGRPAAPSKSIKK